jgi:hypothetical protein
MTPPTPELRSTCGRLRPPMAVLAIVLVALVGDWRVPPARSTGSPVRLSSLPARSAPLTVVAAPTPRFRVPRYDTSGTYPQVRDANLDLSAVNSGLREGVLLDQREYAPAARKNSAGTAKRYRGVYETSIDRRLLSASTVVVSALMPATKLYPGGNEGNTWVAVTVRVPSGRLVSISSLFADPSRGLRALASAWKARVRRTNPRMWPCVRFHLPDYRPGARRYRYFALTAHGLAVGFWQEPACDRLAATVPYAVLRPYLGKLGMTLIAGVRRPRG